MRTIRDRAALVIVGAGMFVAAPARAECLWNISGQWKIRQDNGYIVTVSMNAERPYKKASQSTPGGIERDWQQELVGAAAYPKNTKYDLAEDIGAFLDGVINNVPDRRHKDTQVFGGLRGLLESSNFRMRVIWSNTRDGDAKVGIYEGVLRDDGYLQGRTYAAGNPGASTNFITTTPFRCMQAYRPKPGSPVTRAIGKPTAKPRATTEISPAGIQRASLTVARNCRVGFVWREARSGDYVCVSPGSRSTAAQENRTARQRTDPGAGSGPNGCASGFVWREAYPGDVVCVVPGRRSEVARENSLSPSRTAQ